MLLSEFSCRIEARVENISHKEGVRRYFISHQFERKKKYEKDIKILRFITKKQS